MQSSGGIPVQEMNILQTFEGKDVNEARMTSNCILYVSKNLSHSELTVSASYMPLAKFIIYSSVKMSKLAPVRDYIQPLVTNLVSQSTGNVVQYLNCKPHNVINVWSHTQKEFLRPIQVMFEACPKERELMKNKHFVGYGYGYAPYFTDNEANEIDGMDPLVLKTLASHFEFNLELRRSAGWDKVIDGQWTNGTIGQVYHGNSQFGIGSLAFTTERYSAVDYTHYTFFCGVRFFMNQPGPIDPFLKALTPIDTWGWLGFVTLSLVVGLALIGITWTHPALNATTKSFDMVI